MEIENTVKNNREQSRGPLIKILVLISFIVLAVYLVRFSPLKDYFTPEALGKFVAEAGLWAPLAFIAIYTVGVCLFVPGTLLTGLGAAIFGPYWGFICVECGTPLNF